MAPDTWPTKRLSVASLHLDAKNPRLGREYTKRAPRELVQYLFEHDKALEVAQSIAQRGFFPNEALLAYKDGKSYVVVEGNRRLAALKALREPGLLEGPARRKVERLSRLVVDAASLASVPVTIAPSRRATDGQLVARHMGTPVRAWEAENRASFILEKLEEGYTNDSLCDELGFTPADIQKARQTRAVADMARSLDLPEEVKAKLDARPRVFSTLGRVFDMAVGRKFLQVEPDAEHGVRGTTTKKEFSRVFSRLVTDVALSNQDSRTLNTAEDIKNYFESWPSDERPQRKRGKFVPSDIITGKSTASPPQRNEPTTRPKKPKRESRTVLPKDLKVRFGTTRLKDIHRELTRLKRADYPNAGAVLLRVFFELAALEYLKRTGELADLIKALRSKGKLPIGGVPTMKQLTPALIRIAKKQLTKQEATTIEKAITPNPAAPFSISDLHSFVHNPRDMPGERDILQFWTRTEPLFRLMLEQDPKAEPL